MYSPLHKLAASRRPLTPQNPLKYQRQLRKLTQKEAAAKLGIGVRAYQRYEVSDAEIPDLICRLVALGALDVDVNKTTLMREFVVWNSNRRSHR